MTAQSFGESQRSIADKMLRKTLIIGLGGSALLHTAAIAGVSYWSQNNISDLNITEIERVEIDPEPSPAPTIKPIAKPIPTPEPKVVKPIIASVPSPIPIKIPTPKPIPTPAQVVKITKSAAVKSSISPLSNLVASAPIPSKTAPTIQQKSNPAPSFPNKLFTDLQPKSARTNIAARKIDNNPLQNFPIKDSQPTAANNQAAFAPTNQPSKFIPNSSAEITDNPADNEELIPSSPGNTTKLARTTDRSPIGNNQTSLGNQAKSPPGFGDSFGSSIDPNTPAANDDFAGIPGNNTRIANNNQTTAPTSNNQIGLSSNPTKQSGLTTGFANSGGDDHPHRSEEIGGDTPGNIATGSRNQASIQCLRNCEIRYPDELETTDIGKDKILVRVTIDSTGSVTNAVIARSSGNQKLDRVTIDGVKQMQLNATGKTRIHKIRISTLINN